MDEAVRLTLEMGSYLLSSRQSMVAQISTAVDQESEVIRLTSMTKHDPIQLLLERVDRIETELGLFDDLRVIWSNTVLEAPALISVKEEDQDRNPSTVGTVELKVMSYRVFPLSISRWKMRNPRCCEPAGEGEQKVHVSQTNIPTFSVDTESDYVVVEGSVNEYSVNILIDTCAAATIVSGKVWEIIRSPGAELTSATGKKLVGVQGTPLKLNGMTHIDIELCSEKFSSDVIVADFFATDNILGRDFLKAHKCIIEMTPMKDLYTLNNME